MSDENRPGRPGQQDEAGDEVEAHGHGGKHAANAEPADEADDADDFEAHSHGGKHADKMDKFA